MATMTPSRVDELLSTERADVWREYLDAIRGMPSCSYEDVEPWAWRRLERRLAEIDVREQAALKRRKR